MGGAGGGGEGGSKISQGQGSWCLYKWTFNFQKEKMFLWALLGANKCMGRNQKKDNLSLFEGFLPSKFRQPRQDNMDWQN